MNIIFLTRLYSPHIGGVEKHVYEISKILVLQDNTVTVITEMIRTENGGWAKQKDNVDGITVIRIRAGKDDWFKKFRIWIQLLSKIDIFLTADIIHCHDVFFWYIPFRIILFWKKVYTTFHGYEMIFPPAKKAIAIRKLNEIFSRGNICIGKYIEKWYGTKATFISYGATNYLPQLTASTHTSDTCNILLLGRLEKDIGVEIYLRMFEILKSNDFKFTLKICGDGSYKEKFKKYTKDISFVTSPVHFIKQADIILASSYLSIIESLILKKPVFSVYTNPLKQDYLTMTPFSKWISISDNPKVLADNIMHIKIHYPKNKLDEGFNWAKKQDWKTMVDTYLKLWKK